MPDRQLRTLLRHLQRTTARGDASGLTDGQLLERFATARQETAFEALVWRHGTMVLNVCRRLLHRPQDAEDAFQATFLMLVRKASAIHKREAVGSWLYKVAYRVALRARLAESRRAQREPQGLEFPPSEPEDDLLWRDLRPLLDEEVNRLPEKYRRAVVLCYLSGKSTEEAAAQLGCPRGTVLSRLAWARARLRGRLARRGLAPTAAALAAPLAENAASASLPRALVDATVKAALWFAAGKPAVVGMLSPTAVSLMEGVVRAMHLTKIKWAVGLLVVGAALAIGVGLWAVRPATADPIDKKKDDAGRAAPKAADDAQPAAKAQAPQRPLGTWDREIGPNHITLRFDADHLYGTAMLADKDKKITFSLDADYSVTRDSVLYGVITGADVPGAENLDNGEALALAAQLPDQPFSARYRVDGTMLTIKDVKFGGVGLKATNNNEMAELLFVVGRYKKKSGAGEETPW
jgi:RNA polymerase sigma factor (sigma-70 family)